MNLDLNFLLDLQKIRIERKTTEELLEKLFREQTPSDYPTTTLQGEKVQSNHMTKTAETVVLQIQQLMFYLETQRDNLIKTEIEAIKKINIEVKTIAKLKVLTDCEKYDTMETLYKKECCYGNLLS